MPALRLLLLASALLALSLCWSVTASQSESTIRPGSVTDYITPMANLSVQKLVGRWYVAEHTFWLQHLLPRNVTEKLCLIQDFYYNDNGTLVVEPISLIDGVPSSSSLTLPVSDTGVWDYIRRDVIIGTQVVVDLSEDNRFLAIASCRSGSRKPCMGVVMVRHIEDAGRDDRLAELHRRLVRAGVDTPVTGIVKAIGPCRLIPTTPSPDLTADNGPSTPGTE